MSARNINANSHTSTFATITTCVWTHVHTLYLFSKFICDLRVHNTRHAHLRVHDLTNLRMCVRTLLLFTRFMSGLRVQKDRIAQSRTYQRAYVRAGVFFYVCDLRVHNARTLVLGDFYMNKNHKKKSFFPIF